MRASQVAPSGERAQLSSETERAQSALNLAARGRQTTLLVDRPLHSLLLSSMSASIPTVSTGDDGAVYYHINVRLPLRSLTVLRRYSDFDVLVSHLCKDLGIDARDFPHALPAKRLGWFRQADIVLQRKVDLAAFVNAVIRDRELQNHPLVRDFLELPVNFKFTQDAHADTLPDIRAIDAHKWLEHTRKLRYSIQQLQSNATDNATTRVAIRDKVLKVIKPNLVNLEGALTYLTRTRQIDQLEANKRNIILADISQELEILLKKLEATPARHDLLASAAPRRVLGDNHETNSTLPLNNKELLQMQISAHQQQDQEIEQLRGIIQRQREIGQVINSEISEQNEMLDQFNQEVDASAAKLNTARGRIRKLG